MLSNISWTEYLSFVTVSASIYYLFVLVMYYWQDFVQAVNTKWTSGDNQMNYPYISLKEPSQIVHEDFQTKPDNSVAESFADEVRAYFEEACKIEISKNFLLQCLGVIAGKYSSLAQSVDRYALDIFMIHKAKINCGVLISEDEIRDVWMEHGIPPAPMPRKASEQF